jgi:hypothetical protein
MIFRSALNSCGVLFHSNGLAWARLHFSPAMQDTRDFTTLLFSNAEFMLSVNRSTHVYKKIGHWMS